MKVIKCIICSLLFFVTACSFSQKKILSVKSFGAVNDGSIDATSAFQKCFKEAEKYPDVTVVIPSGKYLISKTIKVDIAKVNNLTVKGDQSEKPQIYIKSPFPVFQIEGNKDMPLCNVDMENLIFNGNNSPYSPSHKYFNTYVRGAAAYFYNTKSLTFKNNEINNIYGDGILVKNLNYKNLPLKYRTVVDIENNKIINVWGQKNKSAKGKPFANYGDGICFNNVCNSTISGNIIVNNLNDTKQYGRGGIVVEYNCQNLKIENNTIGGYEAGIHFESDFGGHKILNNRFNESENGIFCFLTENSHKIDQPMVISGNSFSNEGIPKNLHLNRIRSKSERGLISIITKGDLRKNTIIENNKFDVNNNYQFNSDCVIQVYANDVVLKDNMYSNDNFKSTETKPIISFLGRIKSANNERLNNVSLKAKNLNNSLRSGFKTTGASKLIN